MTLTLHGFALELPVRPPRPEDDALAPFAPPEGAAQTEMEALAAERPRRERHDDPDSGTAELLYSIGHDRQGEPALQRYSEIGLDVGLAFEIRFRLRDGDPIAAGTEIRQQRVLRRGDWSVRVETRVRLDRDGLDRDGRGLRLRGVLEAWEGERRVCSRRWGDRLPHP